MHSLRLKPWRLNAFKMAARQSTHVLPYFPDQLYDLVADVRKYPDFLPFCVASRILSESETEILADLKVGYKVLRETFRSRVHLTPKTSLEVEYVTGPFHYLKNRWEFKKIPEGTEVTFLIDFQFRNVLFQKAMQTAFEDMFKMLLGAFEKRAHALYRQG